MKMKYLIERCEQDFAEEFNPFKSGKLDAKIINRDAEMSFGTNDVKRCANGYHMSDDGKCVPTKGLGNALKRKFTPISKEQGEYLDKPCCGAYLPLAGRRSKLRPPACRWCTGSYDSKEVTDRPDEGPRFFKKK